MTTTTTPAPADTEADFDEDFCHWLVDDYKNAEESFCGIKRLGRPITNNSEKPDCPICMVEAERMGYKFQP